MRILLIISLFFLMPSCTPSNSSVQKEEKGAVEDNGDDLAVFVSSKKKQRNFEFTGGTPVAKKDRIKRGKSDFAFIRGRINGKLGRRVKFTPKSPKENQRAKRLAVRKDSTFRGKMTLDEGQYFVLDYNRKQYEVFLTPGDSITVDLDTEDKNKAIVFSGLGAGHNSYLKNREYYDYELSMKKRNLYQLDYKEFEDSLTYKRDILIKHLDHVASITPDFTEEFVDRERKTLYLDWALDHMNYKALSKKYGPSGHEERVASFNYDFLDELDMKDETLMDVKPFQELMKNYFEEKIDKKVIEKIPGNGAWTEIAVARATMKYDAVDEFTKIAGVRDYLKTEIVDFLVREDGSQYVNDLVLRHRKEVKNENYIARIQKSLDKFAYIEDGALAPELVMEDVAGKEIYLSDFQGKYVYIDVWASWCGPCRHEIPYFQRLKKEYKDKNIEFISISIDKTQAPWKQFLYDWKMYDNQYYVNGVGPSDLSGKYKIQGLPQFILIDPDGKIVDLSASRPSGRIRNDLAMLKL